MQVTFGEEGSAASKEQPFLRAAAAVTAAGNMGDCSPALTLPLLRRRRLREEESDGAPVRAGDMRDLAEGTRMVVAAELEVLEGREVKQMKSSLAPEVVVAR